MRYFDPHIHMFSRTTDDYQSMSKAGVRAVMEPAFWLGQPRTQIGSFIDYFNTLIGWEPFRASQFGVKHYCSMGLNAKEANNEALAEAVMEILPRYIVKEGVVAVGEIGYDEVSKLEEKYFIAQLALAKEHSLPVVVHTPHRDKKRGVQRSIDVCREVGIPDRLVIMDHNNEETLPLVLETGMWPGHSIYPNTKMSPDRMAKLVLKYGHERFIINSASDWGVSDPLSVVKCADEFRKSGISEDVIRIICWQNPIDFFKQSGQVDEAELNAEAKFNQADLFEDNSVLRGQSPEKK